MDDDVTGTLHGMDSNTANSHTAGTEHGETTPRPTLSGVAGIAMRNVIAAHSSRLSAAEARTLARITKDRRNGFMVSACDVDFLLEVIGRH